MTEFALPAHAASIRYQDGQLQVPDCPVVPVIEGDGIGRDVTPAMRRVVDAAVAQAYQGKRQIAWLPALAGEVAFNGVGEWLPADTLEAIRTHRVAIKGPLATPVGGGIRSINVTLRQTLDLYQCLRPVRYFTGVPSPVKHPERVNMVIFRENTEDIYAGIEWAAESDGARQVIGFLREQMGVTKIRFPDSSAIGIKPISREGSERLIRAALQYTLDNDLPSLTLVHKGNIMKFTEGGFRDWGYALAAREFGAEPIGAGPWLRLRHPRSGREVVIKDVIADAFFQEALLRPEEYSVVATPNLNGDYLSDALAAQVGGIGIAPGANLGDGYAVFEATHGTAPKIAGQGIANPGSLILSAEMMLRHFGWIEAADAILFGMEAAIGAGEVTADFATPMGLPKALSTAEFAEAVVARMA